MIPEYKFVMIATPFGPRPALVKWDEKEKAWKKAA